MTERILQFGTGILLRGLPDYFIDSANKKNLFDGTVVVVKSTEGDVAEFIVPEFKTYVRGLQNGQPVEEEFVNSSWSRVIAARTDWRLIMAEAGNENITIVISNTTEAGITNNGEMDFIQSPPDTFPGKITAFLFQRFTVLGESSPETIVIPTELIPQNGQQLYELVKQLAQSHPQGELFLTWMDRKVFFCNSLVDRIVTRPSQKILATEQSNSLAIQTEPYRLWAIESAGPKKVSAAKIKSMLPFADADGGIVISDDITHFRERKLRLLNGAHTISVCLGFLKGFNTVGECMLDSEMRSFIARTMTEEILPTLPSGTPGENLSFAREVLDRFSNPYTEHRLLSITFQSTLKMKMRNVLTFIRYSEKFGKVPENLAKGFAAYLLFMKVRKKEGGQYFGKRGDEFYLIQDDAAGRYFEIWKDADREQVVKTVCADRTLWDADLTTIPGFVEAVTAQLVLLAGTLA